MMNPAQSAYNTAVIRRLLLGAFSDEEFTVFCYDNFREVYQKFAAGITFTAKAQTLIEHCELRSEFDKLLPLLEEANPARYAEFASTLQKTDPKTIPNSQPPTPDLRSLSRQPFEPEMILIPTGEFLMGSDPRMDPKAQDNELPQHLLYLPNFYLAKTPVTNTQFLAFVKATGYQTSAELEGWGWVWTGKAERIKRADWQYPSGPKSHITSKYDHPVVQVSWHDAVAYCNWLAEITGKPYSLPSEAEWEKGARGTDGRIYPWGNEWDAKRCNSGESGLGDTTPVGAYPNGASPYGLLDVAGNIWEWTRSLWGFKYPYRPGDGWENLKADYNARRVLRGGSWGDDIDSARCAMRDGYISNDRNFGFGFRVVLSPSLQTLPSDSLHLGEGK